MALSRAWRWAAVGLAALLLLLAAMYWLLGAWLEGAGGRAAVEQALAERLGMPVRLRGEFSVTLLPHIGVGGTDLALGPDGEVLRGHEYAVSLALRPLLDRRLVIESLRLDGGALDAARWASLAEASREAPSAGSDVAATFAVPEIRHLSVRDFDWLQDGEPQMRIASFRLYDFAPGQDSGFTLDLGGFVRMDGTLRWVPATAELSVSAVARGDWPGELQWRALARLADAGGDFHAQWRAEPDQPALGLDLAWLLIDAGLAIGDIALDAQGQAVQGSGCLLRGDATALQLDLSADRLVLEPLLALQELFPVKNEVGDADWPVLLNVRLRVQELRAADATAHDAVLQLGAPPVCPAAG